MNVLHVTTFLQGGAGRIITDLATAQRHDGHDVRLVVDAGAVPGYSTYPEYTDALQQAGIPVLPVCSTFARDVALNRAAARDVQRLTARWTPDVVHAHAATPATVARLAGLQAPQGPACFVHTMHGWGIAKTARQAADDLAALALADLVVTPSRASMRELQAMGLAVRPLRADTCVGVTGCAAGAQGPTSLVIPYGLAREAAGAPDAVDAERIVATSTGRTALCIGTIGERKNQRLLVEALRHESARSTVAVFVGDGDLSGLTAFAEALGVGPRAIVLGQRAEASRYLALADVLVLPSRNEGLPLAVLEALRVGVPVVATNIPEIAEAVGDEGRDLLFESDDAAGLAEAMARATSEGGDRAKAARQARFAEHYTRERMAAEYAAAYAALGRASRGGRHFVP